MKKDASWLTAPFRLLKAIGHIVRYWLAGCPVIAPAAVVAQREEVCRKCMYSDFDFCRRCKCYLPAKVMLSSEECPEHRWKRLTTTVNPR